MLRNRRTRDLLVSTIVGTSELDRHAFGLKRAVLRCELRLDDPSSLRSRFPIRETDVFTGSSELVALADRSDRVEPVRGDRVLLAATTDLPPAGRLVTVSGRRVRGRLTRLGGVVRYAPGAPVHDGLAWLDVSAVAARPDGVDP